MTPRRKLSIASWSAPSEGNIYGKLTVDATAVLSLIRLRLIRGLRDQAREAAMTDLGPPAVICRRCAAAMPRFSFRCNDCGVWDSAVAFGERVEAAPESDLRSAVDLPA